MCPICLGTAALAAMAGTGSAGGLAALVAVKLHIKPKLENDRALRVASSKLDLRPQKAGGAK
ncbi:MAG: hypothetical protein ACTHMO_03455 [Rhodanobacteraceae bacterium]